MLGQFWWPSGRIAYAAAAGRKGSQHIVFGVDVGGVTLKVDPR